MWARIGRELKWALIVALAGAVAGLIYSLVSGGALYPDAARTALIGAVLASAALTAIKMFLDP